MHRRSRHAHRHRGRLILVVVALAAVVGLAVSASPARAQVEMSQEGTVGIRNPIERQLFSSLSCTCGTCPGWTLDKCTCGFAAERREELRDELAKGKSIAEIQAEYAHEYGTQALALPPNEGMHRLVWLGPLLALVAGAGMVGVMLRRWSRKGAAPGSSASQGPSAAAEKAPASKKRDDYDDRLDEELKDLDDE